MVYNEGFGGSFYASQTFFPDNLPGKKIYQIGWMITFGVAGGNTTSPWTHSATLACELKLKTLPEGIRVTRTLVPGFESLYGSTQTWSNQTLNAGHNFFEGKYSKCFDLEVVLDITNATATDVAFKFSDKIINYNVDEQILFRDKLYARNNQVKIRFVVDWGSLEVFGNDGEYSYVEGVKFSPKDQSISMIPNGHIKLVSATLRELKRIWPGDNVNNMYIDGADARNKYTGNWGTGSNERMYFGSDCHIAFEDNCSLETSFTGTHISWYALKNDDLGMASVYIDGVLAEEDIDCYSTNRCVSLLFSKTNLPEGEHTIKVVRNGKKNPASRGFALVHDYFGLEGSFGIESAGDDASVKMKYTGDWNAVTDDLKFYQHTYHKNTSGNGTVEYSFAGTQIYWHGMKDANLGNVSIYIDNVPVADNIDCYAGTPAITRLFAKRDLAKGNHTIKIVAKNTKNELSSGTGFVHDYCDSPELIPLYIDDTSTRNVYTGEWGTGIESIYFNNTCRWASNASIELEFWGNTIEWHALKNNDLGYVTVYIDGKKTEDIDCYSNDRQVVKFFERHNLSNGKHTIKIVTKGEKNPSSNGYAMVHDCFKVQSVPAKSLSVTGHLNFGPVQINTSATQNITITNADLYPVSILGIELPEAYSCNWSKGELQPNESKTVAVTFSPAAIKIYEGNIHIHSNFGTESVFTTGKESTVSSVPDNVKNENINLFPNPVKDKLYVTATDVKTIEILNSTGTVLVKNEVGGENISEIDLSEIPSGALMVKLTKNTKESITAKVIKQ